jgi:hypothetical protein
VVKSCPIADAQIGGALAHGAHHLGAQVFFQIDLDAIMFADEGAKVLRQN